MFKTLISIITIVSIGFHIIPDALAVSEEQNAKVEAYVQSVEAKLSTYKRFSGKTALIRREVSKVKSVQDSELQKILTDRLRSITQDLLKNKFNDITYKRDALFRIDNSSDDIILLPLNKKYRDTLYKDGTSTLTYAPSLKWKTLTGKFSFSVDAKDDLQALSIAYMDDNGRPLKVNSAYRSITEQKTLYASYSKNNKSDLASLPGRSEHHLGTAFDFQTDGGDWFENNAIEYGFVRSFDERCENKTGVKPEAWHYRWIGRDNAEEYKGLKEANVDYCLSDYLMYKTGKYPQEIKETVWSRDGARLEYDDALVECVYSNLTVEIYKNAISVLYDNVCKTP